MALFMNKKLKNPVGRPRIIDRSILIDIALNEYWIYGINNVSLSLSLIHI